MPLCKPKFRPFPWEEYPTFCHQLKQYGLSDEEAYALCETSSENIYYTNRENGWHNFLIETKLKPTKTIWNKVGEFFAQGTDCTCCLGWRVGIALVLGLFVGFISGVLV